MKNNYLMQTIELRLQIDHINPMKNRLFEEYRGATNSARLFMIIIRHRGIKMTSDGKKIVEKKSYLSIE